MLSFEGKIYVSMNVGLEGSAVARLSFSGASTSVFGPRLDSHCIAASLGCALVHTCQGQRSTLLLHHAGVRVSVSECESEKSARARVHTQRAGVSVR